MCKYNREFVSGVTGKILNSLKSDKLRLFQRPVCGYAFLGGSDRTSSVPALSNLVDLIEA